MISQFLSRLWDHISTLCEKIIIFCPVKYNQLTVLPPASSLQRCEEQQQCELQVEVRGLRGRLEEAREQLHRSREEKNGLQSLLDQEGRKSQELLREKDKELQLRHQEAEQARNHLSLYKTWLFETHHLLYQSVFMAHWNKAKLIVPAPVLVARGSESVPDAACGGRDAAAEAGWPRQADSYAKAADGEQHPNAQPHHRQPAPGEQPPQQPAKPAQAGESAAQGQEHKMRPK